MTRKYIDSSSWGVHQRACRIDQSKKNTRPSVLWVSTEATSKQPDHGHVSQGCRGRKISRVYNWQGLEALKRESKNGVSNEETEECSKSGVERSLGYEGGKIPIIQDLNLDKGIRGSLFGIISLSSAHYEDYKPLSLHWLTAIAGSKSARYEPTGTNSDILEPWEGTTLGTNITNQGRRYAMRGNPGPNVISDLPYGILFWDK